MTRFLVRTTFATDTQVGGLPLTGAVTAVFAATAQDALDQATATAAGFGVTVTSATLVDRT